MDGKEPQATTPFETLRMMKAIARIPATPLMVLSRERVGFRIVNPNTLMGIGLTLLGLAYFSANPPGIVGALEPHGPSLGSFLLGAFAVLTFGMGMLQRSKRWNDLCHGIVWHGNSPGVCYLERLRLPARLHQHRRLYRYLEPFCWLVVGGLTAFVAPLLGYLIMFGAVCMRWHEELIHENMVESVVKTGDGYAEMAYQRSTTEFLKMGIVPDSTAELAGMPSLGDPDMIVAGARMRDNLTRRGIIEPETPDPVQPGGARPVYYKDTEAPQEKAQGVAA